MTADTWSPSAARGLAHWASQARGATARRDRLVCQMHDQGASYRAIAEAAGLSAAGVRRIVARRSTPEGG